MLCHLMSHITEFLCSFCWAIYHIYVKPLQDIRALYIRMIICTEYMYILLACDFCSCAMVMPHSHVLSSRNIWAHPPSPLGGEVHDVNQLPSTCGSKTNAPMSCIPLWLPQFVPDDCHQLAAAKPMHRCRAYHFDCHNLCQMRCMDFYVRSCLLLPLADFISGGLKKTARLSDQWAGEW